MYLPRWNKPTITSSGFFSNRRSRFVTAVSAVCDSTGWIGLPLSSRPCVTPLRDMVKAEKKKRSETNTNTDEVWTRRGREFKQAESLKRNCE